MTKYNVDLKIEQLNIKITGTITSDDIIVPPPPPDPDPDPDPDPQPTNIVLKMTVPLDGATVINDLDMDSSVTIDGASPTSGLLEYELVSIANNSIMRLGRQANAPWTHRWDSTEVVDGQYTLRSVWITDQKEVKSPTIIINVSNKPVIPPPPPPPNPGTNKVWNVATDADLTGILLSSQVQPGDTILIAPGAYKGTRYVRLHGLPGKRITVMAAKFGTVTIDVGTSDTPNAAFYFDITSNYTLVKNLVITCSKVGRSGEQAHGFNVIGGNHRVENCCVYGLAEGYFWSKSAVGDPSNPSADANDLPGAKFCWLYHEGYTQPGTTRGHGHGGYAQGDYRNFFGLVTVGGFGMGTRLWGTGAAYARNSGLTACVNVNTGVLYQGQCFGPTCITIGDQNSPVNCWLDNVHCWVSKNTEGGSWVGDPFENGIQDQVRVENCYFVGGSLPMQYNYLKRLTAKNNVTVADSPALFVKMKPLEGNIGTFTGNRFYGSSKTYREGSANGTVAQFTAKYPGNSCFDGRPPNSVHVYPDPAGDKRALVVAYNWTKQPTISIPIPWSGAYTLRNALDILSPPLAMGDGSEVIASMSNQTIVQPPPTAGINVKNIPLIFDASGKFLHPGSEFGCFFVEVE